MSNLIKLHSQLHVEVHVKMYTTAFLMIIRVGMRREKLISGKISGVSLN